MYDLDLFSQLSEAEDFFEFFEVAFDPGVLARHRVALLRAWAHSVAQIDKRLCGASAEQRLWRYGEALQELHGAFAAGLGASRLAPSALPCTACPIRRHA